MYYVLLNALELQLQMPTKLQKLIEKLYYPLVFVNAANAVVTYYILSMMLLRNFPFHMFTHKCTIIVMIIAVVVIFLFFLTVE